MNYSKFLLSCLILFFVIPAFSQQPETEIDSAAIKADYDRAYASFEPIVNKFAAFFQVKQKLFYKFEYPKSKSGFAAYIIEYTCKEVNYGVTNTNKPQVPYVAHILLNISKRDNRSCGNTASETILGPPAGWDNVEDALANDKEPCFKSVTGVIKSRVRLNFEYKEGRWEFKNAVIEGGKDSENAISAALGKVESPAMEISNAAAVDYNKKWLALIP
jgi:hypothetical protein